MTVEEIAVQLGLPIYRVRGALRNMGSQLQSRLAVTPGKRARPRVFHESCLPLVARTVSRNEPPTTSEEAQEKAFAILKDLKEQLRALSRNVDLISTLLQHQPAPESLVLHTLPHPHLRLVRPLTLTLVSMKSLWQAALADLDLSTQATSKQAAAQRFAKLLVTTYESLEQNPASDPPAFELLQQLIERRPLPPSPPPLAATPILDGAIPPPTLDEWKNLNQPTNYDSAKARAWRVGANARYHGDSDCRYRTPALVRAWNRGYRKPVACSPAPTARR